MPLNIQKIGRMTGYILFGFFVFIFFTYLNFPYDKFKDKIFFQVEQKTGLKLDAAEVKPTWTLGFVFTGVELSHRNSPQLHLSHLNVSPSLVSLLFFRPKLKFEVGFTEGTLSGYLHQKGTTQNIGLEFDSLNLTKDLKGLLPLDLQGILQGDFTLTGDIAQMKELNGNLDLRIQKFGLAQMNVLNMNIPQISLSKMILRGTLKNDRLVFEKVDIGGDKEDLQANASGDIQLDPRNFSNSRLNLTVKFRLSEKMKEEFKLFLPFIANALDPQGFYSLAITGRLSAPLALPKKS